ALAVGEVVPVTTQGGPVLAGSYSSRMLRPGTPERGGWDVVLAVGALRRAPDEATLDRRLRQVGRRWISAHPGGTVELVGLHAWRYFDLYWAMGDRLVTATPTPLRWANAASVLSWWAVAVCAAFGLRALWRRGALGPLVPALAVYVTLALSGMLLVAGTRYRAPADVVALLLAAALVAGEKGRQQA